MSALEITPERGLPAGVPSPVANHSLFGGAIGLLAFGKPQNWTLAPYNESVPEHERFNETIEEFLPPIASSFGLGKMLLAPSPRLFNAEICTEDEVMGKRYHIHSKKYEDSVWLEREADADGMLLATGRASVGSYGGCSMLVLRHKPTGIAGYTHVALRSAIDEGMLKGNEPRKNESAVIALVEAMKVAGVKSASNLEAVIAFSIDPRVFIYRWDDTRTFPDGTVYGDFNKIRTEYLVERWGTEAIFEYHDPAKRVLGRPDLPAIIAAQLTSVGVPANSISIIGSLDPEVFPDSRRDDNMRGLLAVVHYGS